MKAKIKLILLLVMLAGCQHDGTHSMVITNKNYDDRETRLPPGICNYRYVRDCYGYDFQDSCSKYDVGDVIIGDTIYHINPNP